MMLFYEELRPGAIKIVEETGDYISAMRRKWRELRQCKTQNEDEGGGEDEEFDEAMFHPALTGVMPMHEKSTGELISEVLHMKEDDETLLDVVAQQAAEEDRGSRVGISSERGHLLEIDSMARFLEKKKGVRDMERRVADLNKKLFQLQKEHPEAAAKLDPKMLALARQRSAFSRKPSVSNKLEA